jgi:hypothetical protein
MVVDRFIDFIIQQVDVYSPALGSVVRAFFNCFKLLKRCQESNGCLDTDSPIVVNKKSEKNVEEVSAVKRMTVHFQSTRITLN